MSGLPKLALATIIATIVVMLSAIVLLVWGIILLYGGPVNALLYFFLFGDAGLLITVIELARRKRRT